MVDRGHVTLAVQNFLFPVQHDLQRSERRTDKKWGQLLGTCWHLFQSQKKKNTLLPAERPSSRGHTAVKHSLKEKCQTPSETTESLFQGT